MTSLRFGDRVVGEGQPCLIVAELSGNHNRSFERAVEMVRAAKRAGADAVKLQTYTPDTLTIQSDRPWFRVPDGSLWAGKTLYELYGEAFTPWEWQPKLQQVACELGLGFFSTPFDRTAVEFLERLDVPAYKIASFELVDLPLLRRIAGTGKPVIASTGMATLEEIEEAVATLRQGGTRELALLKCTSAYPASPSDMNLRTIRHLAQTFDVVAGLSDHTLGHTVAVAAVALGAAVIEKHFTLRRSDGGPDAAFSMEPEEFTAMARAVREAEQALGSVSYQRTPSEAKNVCFRRSLFIVLDVKAGEPFTAENVRPIRPGYGLLPRHLEEVLGRRAACDIARGTPLSWELVARSG
jgi:N-acetylneuraminate synthase